MVNIDLCLICKICKGCNGKVCNFILDTNKVPVDKVKTK